MLSKTAEFKNTLTKKLDLSNKKKREDASISVGSALSLAGIRALTSDRISDKDMPKALMPKKVKITGLKNIKKFKTEDIKMGPSRRFAYKHLYGKKSIPRTLATTALAGAPIMYGARRYQRKLERDLKKKASMNKTALINPLAAFAGYRYGKELGGNAAANTAPYGEKGNARTIAKYVTPIGAGAGVLAAMEAEHRMGRRAGQNLAEFLMRHDASPDIIRLSRAALKPAMLFSGGALGGYVAGKGVGAYKKMTKEASKDGGTDSWGGVAGWAGAGAAASAGQSASLMANEGMLNDIGKLQDHDMSKKVLKHAPSGMGETVTGRQAGEEQGEALGKKLKNLGASDSDVRAMKEKMGDLAEETFKTNAAYDPKNNRFIGVATLDPSTGKPTIGPANSPGVVAHELGHAKIQGKMSTKARMGYGYGKMIGKSLAPLALSAGAIQYGRYHDSDPEKAKKWRNRSLAIGGAGVAPTLLEEAGASAIGMKTLKKMKGQGHNINVGANRKMLTKAFGTYAGRHALPVALMGAGYAAHSKLKKQAKTEVKTPGDAAAYAGGTALGLTAGGVGATQAMVSKYDRKLINSQPLKNQAKGYARTLPHLPGQLARMALDPLHQPARRAKAGALLGGIGLAGAMGGKGALALKRKLSGGTQEKMTKEAKSEIKTPGDAAAYAGGGMLGLAGGSMAQLGLLEASAGKVMPPGSNTRSLANYLDYASQMPRLGARALLKPGRIDPNTKPGLRILGAAMLGSLGLAGAMGGKGALALKRKLSSRDDD